MRHLNHKRIVLIVTGGIAAYKALELVRRLRDAGATVRTVMTDAAEQFVGSLSFQAISGEPVHTDLLDARAEAAMGHIELARWADAVIVAPATADFLAKLRSGFANDLASTVCLATTARILLAPAMNHQMWMNPATQENLAVLSSRNLAVIGPGVGAQACGETGPGRMSEPAEIMTAVSNLFAAAEPELAGLKVMVTAGPTQEAIDPVRYISNRSSGKMGYAIAEAALELGAEVILVSGPVALIPPVGSRCVGVVTAAEMYQAVISSINEVDIFVGCAAVADYHVDAPAVHKRKKDGTSASLTLSPTRDILRTVAARANPPFSVGFAAETENLQANARSKLERKSLDMIAANEVGCAGIGFESDDNELHVLWHDGEARLAKASKQMIARQLVQLIAERYRARM